MTNINIYLQEKNVIKEQDMPEALQESSKIMKAGRAYKNIHAILNKYLKRIEFSLKLKFQEKV